MENKREIKKFPKVHYHGSAIDSSKCHSEARRYVKADSAAVYVEGYVIDSGANGSHRKRHAWVVDQNGRAVDFCPIIGLESGAQVPNREYFGYEVTRDEISEEDPNKKFVLSDEAVSPILEKVTQIIMAREIE